MPERRASAALLMAGGLLVLLAYLPFFLPWDELAGGDYLRFHHPFLASMARDIVAYPIPLWFPEIFAGAAGLPEAGLALLHPLNQALHWLAPLVVLKIATLLHLGLLYLGIWAWARLWVGGGLATIAALASALALQTQATLSWGHFTVFCSLSCYPWMLLAVHQLAASTSCRESWRWGCRLALLYGATWIAGHPQFTMIFSEAGFVYLIGVARLKRGKWPWVGIAGMLAACAAGMAAGLPQVAASLEVAMESGRGLTAQSWEFLTSGSLSFPNLIKWFAPLAFGIPGSYWGPEDFWFAQLFWGAGSLTLVALGLRQLPRFVTLLLILGLLLALGRHTPLLALHNKLVPGATLFRYPVRYLYALTPFLSLALALGLKSCWVRPPARAWALLPLLGLLLPVLLSREAGLAAAGLPAHVAARWGAVSTVPGPFLCGLAEALALLLWILRPGWRGGAVLIFGAALLGQHLLLPYPHGRPEAAREPFSSEPELGRVLVLDDRFFYNEAMEKGCHGLDGYSDILANSYRGFLDSQTPQNWVKQNRVQVSELPAPALRFLNVADICEGFDERGRPRNSRPAPLPPLPRYYLAQSFMELRLRPESPHSEAIADQQLRLSREFRKDFGGNAGLKDAQGTVSIRTYRREEVILDVVCGAPAVLASSENSGPLWRLEVNGVSAPLRRWYGTFRCALLPAGQHTVRFYLDRGPLKLRLAGAAAVILLLLCGALPARGKPVAPAVS